jgi:hypothetical protein
MGVTASSLVAQIEGELSAVKDAKVTGHIRGLLVPPEPQMRAWNYGTPGEAYPCWIVLAEKSSNTAIAYCESGFGPPRPWGLLVLEGKPMSMGMDSGWFDRFLDAYFESMSATNLPIWRLFVCSSKMGVTLDADPLSTTDVNRSFMAAENCTLERKPSSVCFDLLFPCS